MSRVLQEFIVIASGHDHCQEQGKRMNGMGLYN